MSRRTHESPMDFEYANGSGPVDARSPFAQVAQHAQRPQFSMAKQRGFTSAASPSRSSHTPAFTRTQSTPAKINSTAPAAFNGLYNTPRRGESQYDDSSAGETPKSPGRDDSEVPTPEGARFDSKLDRMDQMDLKPLAKCPSPVKQREAEQRTSPESKRRDSMWYKVKSKFYSPGRGEVPRGDLHHVKDRRVRKQRSRDMQLSRQLVRSRRYSNSSAEDADESEMTLTTPLRSPSKGSKHSYSEEDRPLPSDQDRPHWATTLFRFIGSHPTVPHILSFYAQLLFNLFLLLGCAYILWTLWSAVQADITIKSTEATAEIMAEMAFCMKQFAENRCAKETRIPAMEQLCNNWEICMNQDPKKVARGRLTATALAEIFTSFVEPISYKAMIFTFLMVFGCFAISNFAFGMFRDRASPQQHYQPSQYWPQSPAPPTPIHRQDGVIFASPWHQTVHGLEPGPSGGFSRIEGRGSPVRRLRYN